jgi:hypothetical protein
MVKSRRIKWAGHVARMGKMRNAEKTTRVTRHIWEDNMQIDLRETEMEGVDWIHLAQDKDRRRALVNTAMNALV